jgi:hypothetical protein
LFNDHGCGYLVFGQINHNSGGEKPMLRYSYRLCAIAIGVGGVLCFGIGLYAASSSNWSTLAICWFLFGIAGGAYSAMDHLASAALATWSSPLLASKIITLPKSDRVRYALYLRPLLTDAELRIHQTLNPFQLLAPGLGMPFLEMQEWLIRTAPRHWRFLSEGGLTTNVRPVAIEDSGDWFQDIKQVGGFVDVIVIIPGTTPGIILEADHFMQSRIHNVVVVVPPRKGNEKYFATIVGHRHELLRQIAASPASGAFVLPDRLGKTVSYKTYPLTRKAWRCILEARRHGASI